MKKTIAIFSKETNRALRWLRRSVYIAKPYDKVLFAGDALVAMKRESMYAIKKNFAKIKISSDERVTGISVKDLRAGDYDTPIDVTADDYVPDTSLFKKYVPSLLSGENKGEYLTLYTLGNISFTINTNELKAALDGFDAVVKITVHRGVGGSSVTEIRGQNKDGIPAFAVIAGMTPLKDSRSVYWTPDFEKESE